MNHQYQGIHIQLPKSESMSTDITYKINKILSDRYPNNYAGRQNMAIRQLHAEMREKLGEEKFLEYLEEQEQTSPRPKYEYPNINADTEFKWTDELVEELIWNEYGSPDVRRKVSDFKASHSIPEGVESRGWEIESYYHNKLSDGKIIGVYKGGKYWDMAVSGHEDFSIYSVRRLSDSQLLQIDDITNHGRITGFRIYKWDKSIMQVEYESGMRNRLLHEVEKAPEVKEPLEAPLLTKSQIEKLKSLLS